MKDVTMGIEWRTVQLFLEVDGVCEVEIDADNNTKVRCTCKGFNSLARCKHVKHVKKSMAENGGNYSISIPEEVDEEEAFAAMSDTKLFRDFIIKYGKVEVLD